MNIALVARGRRAASDGSGRAIRIAAALPLSTVATACGVHRKAVMKWERGTSLPMAHHAEQYAKVLDQLQRELARP